MTRTQVQLPDELYRRGVEMLLSPFPEASASSEKWKLPKVDCGNVLVPLEDLHRISADDEAARSLPR